MTQPVQDIDPDTLKVKLPKIRNIFSDRMINPHERLYYGSKVAKKYGRIPNLINEIKLKLKKDPKMMVEPLAPKPKKKQPELKKMKMSKNKLIENKRAIFLSSLSVEMKQQSIQALKDFVKNQELEVAEQSKRSNDLQLAMQRYVKEQSTILQNLKDKVVRKEQENYEKAKELNLINAEIDQEKHDLKLHTDKLKVIF